MDLDRLTSTFFNAEIAVRYLPDLLKGALITIELGGAVIVAGLAFGLLLAYLRSLRSTVLSGLIGLFVDVFRSLPPLVLIILLYYALPSLGVSLSAFASTWLALALVLSAFAEEVFWAGICAQPRGLSEAARSTGMGHTQTMLWVVLPLAFRMMIAPLTNRVIAITKGTAYGSVAALNEILNQATSATSFAGNPTPLVMGAAGYLIIFIPVVVAGRLIEQRCGNSHH